MSATIDIEVVYALPDRCWRHALQLPAGATVADALAAATPYLPADATHDTTTAVFGQAVESGWVLDDGDRVELLRPLLADPKQARRERAGHHRRT